MRALDRIEAFIFRAPAWRLVAVVALVALVKTGVWFMPSLGHLRAMAVDPFTGTLFGFEADYRFWSWLGPFLAWAVGATGTWSFFLFHLAFCAGFAALFIGAVFRRLPGREARVSLILFVLLPVSTTALFWVGYDSVTLFLMLAAVVFTRPLILAVLIGIGLGMQHFEQAFFGFGGLLMGMVLTKRYGSPVGYRLCRAVAVLSGVVIGRLGLAALFDYLDIVIVYGRGDWVGENLFGMLGQFFLHLHYVVWSVLGLGWVVVVKYLDRGKDAVPFLVPLFGLMLLLPFVEDQTRVLAVVTFPLIAAFWLFDNETLGGLGDRLVSWLFLLWIIVPWGWVWKGLPRLSVFPFDVAYLLHRAFGWFSFFGTGFSPF